MGVLPKLKRRCFGPGIVSLAAILSALLLYTFLFARPSYLQRPELLPPFESNEDKSSGVEENTDKNFHSDQSYGLGHTPETEPPPDHTYGLGDPGKDSVPDQPYDLGAEKDAPLVETSSITHTTSAPPVVTSTASEVAAPANNGTVDTHLESSKVASDPFPTATVKTNSSTPAHHDAWEFNSSRDSRAYGLTVEQCGTAFPGLFVEIERAVAARKDLGRISPEDIDITSRNNGMVQALILDQQVCPNPGVEVELSNYNAALYPQGNGPSQRIRRLTSAGDPPRDPPSHHYVPRAVARHRVRILGCRYRGGPGGAPAADLGARTEGA
jgi:hypothetical protein